MQLGYLEVVPSFQVLLFKFVIGMRAVFSIKQVCPLTEAIPFWVLYAMPHVLWSFQVWLVLTVSFSGSVRVLCCIPSNLCRWFFPGRGELPHHELNRNTWRELCADQWTSFSVQLSPPQYSVLQFSHSVLSGFSVPSPWLWKPAKAPHGLSLPVLQPGNSFKAIIQGNHRAHLIGFPPHRAGITVLHGLIVSWKLLFYFFFSKCNLR